MASMSRTESADKALKASLCGARTVLRHFLYMGSDRTAWVRKSMSSLVTAWSFRSRMHSSRSFQILKHKESSLSVRNNFRSKDNSTSFRKLDVEILWPVMSNTSKACGSALFFQVNPSISFVITDMWPSSTCCFENERVLNSPRNSRKSTSSPSINATAMLPSCKYLATTKTADWLRIGGRCPAGVPRCRKLVHPTEFNTDNKNLACPSSKAWPSRFSSSLSRISPNFSSNSPNFSNRSALRGRRFRSSSVHCVPVISKNSRGHWDPSRKENTTVICTGSIGGQTSL
mmetsp:Transcript_15643/g.34737  ORF Transcript_15643/g.34737 Transcript_15643/m.34737 type:complete len:287 (+) Transcript_15643:1526-2386(+)